METHRSILDKAADLSSNVATISKIKENATTKARSTEKLIMQPSTSKVGTTLLGNPTKMNTEQVRNDTSGNDNEKRPRINELDKFKRRLIRAIARLMLVEKKPEEEIWKELKKETTCDCKLLWTRMRALTIKKLKRLIAANDRNEYITKIAQLSVTDWLLFDLVLVHEDVDVIGQDVQKEGEKEPKILEDLFHLVLRYRIESLAGDPLTLAWYELAAEYNSRGRKCSPMLLQRRWYQLKKLVRYKFYNFWFEYRGSMKNFQQADKYKPTNLEMDIVKSFMNIVTNPFRSWEQLIQEQKVSLPTDFERLQLSKKRKPNTGKEDEPDIEVIEPHVETIDLGVESDEDSNDSGQHDNVNKDVVPNYADSNNANDRAIIIKTESAYDVCDEDEVCVLESVHIPLESNEDVAVSNENAEMKASNLEVTNELHDEVQNSNKRTESPEATDIDEVREITDVDNEEYDVEVDDVESVDYNIDVSEHTYTVITQVVEQNDPEIVMPMITSITSTAEVPEIDISDETPEIDNIIERVADKVSQNKLYNTTPEYNTSEQVIDIKPIKISEDKKDIVVEGKTKHDSDFFDEVPNDLHFIDGIELEDDGIEFIDEEEHMSEPKVEIKTETNEPIVINDDVTPDDNVPDDDTPKIDLKLLLNPVVYTKKLDHMDVFRFIDFITVKDKRVINNAALESKPVDKKSVKMEDISKEFENLSGDDTLSDQTSECSSEKEQEVIKSTSWLFRKPRVTTYNPIQLCKNPDFNTRLKRLTVGFFSSQRNRQLLQHCKPLTIDVHKAFESKLVNNCLCLKKSYFSEAKQVESIKTVEKTVLPSELPGQSLNCDTQDSIPSTSIPSTSTMNSLPKDALTGEVCITEKNKMLKDLLTREVCTVERNKVIKLPDLDQIRRKNEKLLIAEVTPLQALSATSVPPVAIVQEKKPVEQNIQHIQDIEIEQVPVDLNDSITSIDVEDTPDINNSSENNDNSNTNTAITIPSDFNTEKLSYYQRMKLLKKMIKPAKTKVPVRKVAVTWNPRNLPVIDNPNPDDRLLARDTVERIISVCKGINSPITKKHKSLMKQTKRSCGELQAAREEKTIETSEEQQQQETTIQSKTIDRDQGTESNDTVNKNVDNLKNVEKTKNGGGKIRRRIRKAISCCWAREKLEFWKGNIKRVRLRHKCPQYRCICCCDVEYCFELVRRRDNRGSAVTCLNLVSDDESDHNSGNISEGQKSSQIQKEDKEEKQYSNKVSVGINTDFDKEFEESYAANVNKLNNSSNVQTHPVISSVTSLRNEESYSNSTQTFSCQQTEAGSQNTIYSLTAATGSKEIVESLNLVSTPSQFERKENKSIKIRPKCKTKIYPSLKFIQTSFKPAVSLSRENGDNKKKSPPKPIYLGKNKILLCSLKPLSKTTMIDVTYLVNNFNPHIANPGANTEPSTLIPKGVHLVLLPNQELVLSIDPGVELDPSQITNLPAILNSVQQQLFTLGIINKMPNADGVTVPRNRKDADVIQLSDDELENSKADTEIVRLRDLEKDICFSKIKKTKSKKSIRVDTSQNEIPSEMSPVVPCTSLLVNNNKNSDDSSPNEIHIEISPVVSSTTQLFNHKENSVKSSPNEIPSEQSAVVPSTSQLVNNNENIADSSQNEISSEQSAVIPSTSQLINNNDNSTRKDSVVDITSEKAEQNVEQNSLPNNSDNNERIDNTLEPIKKVDLKDTVNTSKKTILSDLMEMSGISLEDTAVTNTECPIIEEPTLQPVVYPQELNVQRTILPSNCDVTNVNPLLKNPFVQAALIKCPDLSIVYSFEDLKYAYENNGQFYKMDMDTGIIVPINVCIKKQNSLVKSNIKNFTKAVIDLTEDDKMDNNTFIDESKPEEENIENDTSPNNVKPIKLIKAIHPSILRHNFKSLLRQKEGDKMMTIQGPNMQGKQVVKIIKRKRKQDMKNTNLNINKSKISISVEKKKSITDSESDDEPLALKAKRIRRTSGGTSENVGSNEVPTKNNKETEKVQPSQQEMEIGKIVSPHEPMLTDDQLEDFDPSLGDPVIFQSNNDESSEEDCILGV